MALKQLDPEIFAGPMSSVLITGAAGFIGSHLCEALLKSGYRVTGIDNFDDFYDEGLKRENLQVALSHSNFKFLRGDAGGVELMNSIPYKVDLIVHLAAKAGVLPSLRDPNAYIRTNIELTNNILEWMQRNGVKKMVFASSSSVYGNNTKVPFEESDSVNQPISPYAFTKRSCELMNYTYHALYGMDIINLRFFTVYGERQRPDLAIHKFIRLILNNQPITIYGDGQTARDYTYFSDTISGIVSAINYISQNEKVCETINLGNHMPVSLKDLIAAISDVAGVEPKLIFEPMKAGDVNVTYASIDKAERLLGYHPQVNLRQGLRNFINWYKCQHLEKKV